MRIVALEGSTLPIGALLAVVAPENTPAAEIDSFVAGFVVPEPSDTANRRGARTAYPRRRGSAPAHPGDGLRAAGGGIPVLLLHGFGADLNSWMFTQPALSEGRRAIALDLPGHGGSTKDVGAGDVDALTGAVTAALRALAIERVHVVGHSMGGAVAAAWAARAPDRVATLTLIASAGLGPEINATFIDGFVRATRRRDAEAVLAQLMHDPALVSRAMVEDVLRYKRIDGVTAALETVAAAWFPAGRQAVDLVETVTALPMPVQVIWGRDDRIIPVAHAEALAQAGRVAVHILDAGHLPHMEKAGAVNPLIRRFIEG